MIECTKIQYMLCTTTVGMNTSIDGVKAPKFIDTTSNELQSST